MLSEVNKTKHLTIKARKNMGLPIELMSVMISIASESSVVSVLVCVRLAVSIECHIKKKKNLYINI